jgi:hypothetical protein
VGKKKLEVPAGSGKACHSVLSMMKHNTNVSGEGRTLSVRASCARVRVRGTPEGRLYEIIDEGIVGC